MKEIVFYKMDSGRCPVEEFIDALSAKQAQKIAWVLQLVEELDDVPAQYLKRLVNTDDILEVRVQASGNIFRLLGFLDDGQLVVLNHGFQKKSQKTPQKEIKLAESRKRDYLKRKQL